MKLNIVPARTGLLWVKLGIQTFFRQPLALTGLFFMYMAVLLLVLQLPWVGPLIAALLVPAATLGFMAATAEAASGRFPLPTILVSAFRAGRQRARAMLVLGVIWTVGTVIAGTLGTLLVGESTMPSAAEMQQPTLDWRSVVVLLLHTPLFLMFWHAPALVHWHGVPPAKSLFFSAVACLRNAGALLVYGAAWIAVLILAGLVLSLVGAILGGQAVVRNMTLPVVLLMLAMISSSVYFTFRDSFQADGEAEAPPPPPAGEPTP